jgi:hypothetical protein
VDRGLCSTVPDLSGMSRVSAESAILHCHSQEQLNNQLLLRLLYVCRYTTFNG